MQRPGLYIHVPFCKTKCPYCGFYSLASRSLIPRWRDALKREITYYRDRFDCFDSLYLGGGTPTLLDLGDLEDILDSIFTHFKFAQDKEITIEANPGDLTTKKAKGIKSLGFNRVTLGVQSFNDRELLFMGRRDRAQDAVRALTMLRSFGFQNVGIDLIYGFEGQSLKGWAETLEKALFFRPEHLSCYQLTFEKGTPFQRMKERGITRSISEETEHSFFLLTSRFLEDHGYVHYEISSFARGEAFYSRHNQKYWHHIPYLGLGPSAHSFQNSTRWWNSRSVKGYCEALEGGRAPVAGYEDLTDDQMRLEAISLGLRTRAGLHLKDTLQNQALYEGINDLQKLGFLTLNNGRILPTRKGFLLADHLPLYLL